MGEIPRRNRETSNILRDIKVNLILMFHIEYVVEKAILKPLELGDIYGVPNDRRVLFRRVTFTQSYHKILIELSKKKK